MLKILLLQRSSLVSMGSPSLSVVVRIKEVLEYLAHKEYIEYLVAGEGDLVADRAIQWANVVILNKHVSHRSLELVQLAKKRGCKIVYDIDDWIFSFPSYSAGKNNRVNFCREIINESDIVTVANSQLFSKVPTLFPDAKIFLLPNGIWVEKYIEHNEPMGDLNGDRVIFTNADFLKFQNSKDAILTALHIFFKNNPNYVLDFYGDPFPEMHSLPFLHFTNRMSYGEYLRSVIAGRYKFAITPLGAEEDGEAIEFNLCKNPFKYINYGLCKVPGIYSNSQLYTQCVNNYENGLIVKNTSDDWGNALQQMAEDGGLRNSISENAYCDVVKNYHVKNAAAILFELLS